MTLQLEKPQLDILIEALRERIWSLRNEADGKFPARPGSHRHQLELEAHGIALVLSDIEDQVESES